MYVCVNVWKSVQVRTYDFNSAQRRIRRSLISFSKGSGPGPSTHVHRRVVWKSSSSSLLGKALISTVVVVADSSRRRRRRPSVQAALRFYIIRKNSGVRRKHTYTRVVMENVCRTKRNEKRKRDLLLRTFFIDKKKKEEIFLIRLSGLVRGPHTTLVYATTWG